MARDWLDSRAPNRAISPGIVSMYAAEMKAGNWKKTHQAIAFDSNGQLVDGQHRLSAILDSGVTITLQVCRGMISEDCIAVDMHKKRSVPDSLTISGFKTDKDCVAAANAIWSVLCPTFFSPTIFQIKEIISINKAGMDFLVCNRKNKARYLSISQFYAAVVIAHNFVPEDVLINFMGIYLSGKSERPSENCAAMTHRNWMINNGFQLLRGGRANKNLVVFRALKAIEDFSKNTPVKKSYVPKTAPFGIDMKCFCVPVALPSAKTKKISYGK